ncbi:TPA: hypothetical protein I9781_000327 [Legionella pneumophila]|uniref:hypothetical protein n=1 Tax=Legionella pneumophila TaxID=446 RepID=UPI00145B2B33|nr:hypothetical protein [Legionella pneumophila]HAT3858533.1 hypothetical protein [Legionella pneumophila]HAT3868415.1 hypothetical protein [Legionella pneumophila]HAT3877719.1 hypothetical protein [Legionella pneumophila]HAT3973646.1 hypothetical protein [Legionella pneumophila]HAT3989819.1 hypothetical protein [Legionella pneumophila]
MTKLCDNCTLKKQLGHGLKGQFTVIKGQCELIQTRVDTGATYSIGALVFLWACLKNSRGIWETVPILFCPIDDDTNLGNLL